MQDVVEKRYERIEGEEILMSPASTPHLRIQGNFHAILWNFLKGRRCEVFSEHKVLFEEKIGSSRIFLWFAIRQRSS